jgi:glycosyltransferase involved in cell wall biosynthesis
VTNVFCSTIIPTIGRPSLGRAVESVLQQEFHEAAFEVIVVNDSGVPLPAAEWQCSERVRVLDTNRHERSVARNSGAAVAHGRYLHFLDDDDWLEPGALQYFWELAGRSDAAWLYGSSQTFDRQHKPLIQLHHKLQGNCFLPAMAGEWIPLQASLIEAGAFFALGGFNPVLVGPEDIDLLRRMTLRYDVAGTEVIVANILLGEAGSTTDWERHRIQRRLARETILDEFGAFARFQNSLANLPLSDISWHGQIVRIYVTSLAWNLRRRRFCHAMSRGAGVVVGSFCSGFAFFSPAFWHALTRAYPNPTFARGAAAAAEAEKS